MDKRLDKAKKLYAHALRAYEDWEGATEYSHDRFAPENILLRYAAEKTWQAVALAAIELLETYDCPVPEDVMKLHIEVYNLRKREPAMNQLLSAFISIKSSLHTDCYHDGEILMPEMRYIIKEDAKEFLDNVEALVGIRRYSQAYAPALAAGD